MHRDAPYSFLKISRSLLPPQSSSITLSLMKHVKIVDVRLLPLVGQTPDGGWDAKFSDPDRNLHTLIEVVTDQGVTGLGSVYTSRTLVQGAIQLVKPFLIGASAIDPAATSETLHQHTFWQGRGGASPT